jgi:hypothetical protein
MVQVSSCLAVFQSTVGPGQRKGIQGVIQKFGTGSQSKAYQPTTKRLKESRIMPRRMELAKTTIGWITYAKRPLTVDELEHAVAIVIGSSSFGESNITYMDQMTSFCCRFVVDETTHHIKLGHYSTQK